MISVAAAILIKDELILIARRKSSDILSNKWEFPGGKIENNENPEECLKRELREEFNIDVTIKDFFGESIYQYPNFRIKLIAYRVLWKNGKIKATAHDTYRWVSINEINNYDFAEADIPFVNKLKKEIL